MNFIKKIGQRKFSEYLFIGAIVSSLVIYGLKFTDIGNSPSPSIISILIGTIIFSLPNLLLSMTSHKTTQYRLICLFSSALLLSLNTVLFAVSLFYPHISLFLFGLSLLQIVATSGFLYWITKFSKDNKKDKVKTVNKEKKEPTNFDLEKELNN
jgi:hypothetical protein